MLRVAVRGHHDEQPGILDDGESRIVVRLELRDEVAEDVMAVLDERWPHLLLEDADRGPERGGRDVVEVHDHDARVHGHRSGRRGRDIPGPGAAGQRGQRNERA